jgi:hypothetical protein
MGYGTALIIDDLAALELGAPGPGALLRDHLPGPLKIAF